MEKSFGGKMKIIREIRKVSENEKNEITIKIPKEFLDKEVEIILYPVETENKKFADFLRKSIKIENFKMPSRKERNARQSLYR